MSNQRRTPPRIIIAGGGTGGHVFPAIAIWQALKIRVSEAQVTFIGTRNGIEARVIPANNGILKKIWISGISRRHPLQNLLLPLKLLVSIIQSLWLLLTVRPRVVIGTGGYVMGPVLWLAQRLGIPTVIQEQNSFPGLTTKKLAKRASAVCAGFEDAKVRIPSATVIHTGNPLRQSFRTLAPEQAQSDWPLDFARKNLLVVGGSAGARAINQVIAEALPQLLQKYNLIWQTGKTGVPDSANPALLKEGTSSRRLVIRDFIDEMPSAYAVADLAICRAGAMTLAELAVAGVPAVLIPYPFATDDHQTVNAQSVAKAGAALVIQERELTATTLIDTVSRCLDNPADYEQMRTAMKTLAKPDAALEIADISLKLAGVTS